MNGSKTGLLAAGVWALTSSVAVAADMPLLEHAPVIEEFGGWYLRGDIGMTNQQTDRIHNILMDPWSAAVVQFVDKPAFDSGWFAGLGFGYQFNSWLRTDLTSEYRAPTKFHAQDRYDTDGNGSWDGGDDYTVRKSEWLLLANAYLDLGTWYGFTPFIGAGIGMAGVSLDGYLDLSLDANGNLQPGGGFAEANTTWNFAWALHAGFGYQISPALTLELAYRYVNFGDVKSKDVLGLSGTNFFYNPTTFYDVDSHDVKVALRWALGGQEVVPVVRKY